MVVGYMVLVNLLLDDSYCGPLAIGSAHTQKNV
jgi:hypothetical protein